MLAARSVNLIPPAAPSRRIIEVLNGGANRGARAGLDAFETFNARSAEHAIVPVFVDPAPGIASQTALLARSRGIRADSIEGKIEVLARVAEHRDKVLVVNVDRADSLAELLAEVERHPRPLLAYFIAQTPKGELRGIRIALGADEHVARQAVRAFIEKLALVTQRVGSAAIWNRRAAQLAEPRIRAWMHQHTLDNLDKAVSGSGFESAPIEVTTDGTASAPLLIREGSAWSDPTVLVGEVLETPYAPIARGTSLEVAELVGDEIRLHRARYRTDRRVSVDGAVVLDQASYAEANEAERKRIAAEREERSRREMEAAARRAARETLSRTNPVVLTD